MISIRILMLCLCFGYLSGSVWYKSLAIGSNDYSDVIQWRLLSSKIECAVPCETGTLCKSFLYDKVTNNCTLLAIANQRGHFNSNKTISHYSSSVLRGCPVGYEYMKNSSTCLRLYTEYKSWNDSRTTCLNEGASLPVLDSNLLFSDFTYYMDNVAIPNFRVAVDGFMYNNKPYWSTGQPVNISRFCDGHPELFNFTGVCLYHVDLSNWACKSPINRLEDMFCWNYAYQLCMKQL